jgi:hypothetical protein
MNGHRQPIQQVRKVPIVLQNSFWVTEDKFFEPWVWRSNNYVGDYATVRQTHGRFR